MRASKLIAISTAAVLVGGMSAAIGQSSLPGAGPIHGSSSMNQGSVRGYQPKPGQGSRMTYGQSKMALETGRIQAHRRQGLSPSGKSGSAYARATPSEMEAGLNTQERSRLRDMARDMPRISNVGMDVRINARVPRHVRQAASPLPPEVQRIFPRFGQNRAFRYRDQIVIVNPVTSRIVAIVQA